MTTIKDVAKEAGVSLMTVSRVINETHLVKKDTVDKVNEAINKLGYRPNLLAKSLAKGKSKTIGIISSNMYNQAYIDIIASIERIAYKEGFVVINSDVSNSKDAKQTLDMLLGSKVDGIIILPMEMVNDLPKTTIDYGIETSKFFKYFNEIKSIDEIKVVTISQKIDDVVNIDFDYKKQAKMTLDFLFKKGYKDISFINASFHQGLWQDKEDVYKKMMKDKGNSEYINIEYAELTIEESKKAVERILEKRIPKAIYCANDFIACGAMQGILKRGLNIPKDIAVIGNDDISACEYVYPKLTSIGLGTKEVGEYAINSLLKLFNNEEIKDYKSTPYLVERETT